MVYHVFLLFSFPVKQRYGRKSQPPVNFFEVYIDVWSYSKIRKKDMRSLITARLLREWPTAIQELLPRSSEKGLSRRHDLKNSSYPKLEFSPYVF